MKILTDSYKVPDLTKVVSRDPSRPILTSANLSVERATLEATDSYRLAVIPVEIEDGDVSGLIPGEALAALVKAHGRNKPTPSLHCGETEVSLYANGVRQTWARPQDGPFPNIPTLIPEEDRRSKFRIGLNAKMLAELAKGLGSDNDVVELSFTLDRDKTEGEGRRRLLPGRTTADPCPRWLEPRSARAVDARPDSVMARRKMPSPTPESRRLCRKLTVAFGLICITAVAVNVEGRTR